MTLQISKFLDFTKTQKPRYLENKTLFFLQIKKNSLTTHQGLLYGKKNFCSWGDLSKHMGQWKEITLPEKEAVEKLWKDLWQNETVINDKAE